MKDSIDNLLRTVELLLQFFIDNAIIITIAPAVGTVVEKVRTQKTTLNDLIKKRGGKGSGLTKTKNGLQIKLAKKAERVLFALHSIAAGNNLPDLLEATKSSSSKLLKLRDKALVDKCEDINKIAQPYLAQLPGFNIKVEDVEFLLIGGAEYAGMITAVGNTLKGKSGTTVSIDQAEAQLRHTLEEELDSAVKAAIGESNPDLLVKYDKVREIIDYGIRHDDNTDDENTPPPTDPNTPPA